MRLLVFLWCVIFWKMVVCGGNVLPDFQVGVSQTNGGVYEVDMNVDGYIDVFSLGPGDFTYYASINNKDGTFTATNMSQAQYPCGGTNAVTDNNLDNLPDYFLIGNGNTATPLLMITKADLTYNAIALSITPSFFGFVLEADFDRDT